MILVTARLGKFLHKEKSPVFLIDVKPTKTKRETKTQAIMDSQNMNNK